jgi:hypothetical protein
MDITQKSHNELNLARAANDVPDLKATGDKSRRT